MGSKFRPPPFPRLPTGQEDEEQADRARGVPHGPRPVLGRLWRNHCLFCARTSFSGWCTLQGLDSSFVLDLEPPRVPSEACFGRLEIDSQSARLISPLFLSSPFLSIYFSPACPGRSRVDMELQAWTPQRKLGHISSDLVRFLLERLPAHGLNLHAYTRKMVGGHGNRSHLNSYPCFSDVFGVCRSHTRGPSWLRRSYGEQAENRVLSQSI